MIRNPIQFISRTFTTILNDINSDAELVDRPNWWKRIWAGIGDVFSMWVNAMGNNLVLRTAYTRQNVADLLELINYYMAPQTTSTGTIIFYLSPTASFPVSIARSDLSAQTTGGLTVSALTFEARSGIVVNATTEDILPAAVDITENTLTVARSFITGEKVLLSGADLPAPLQASTEYWVIRVSATTIRLATSLANAYSGTAIDITDIGTGTHTISLYSAQVTAYQQQTQNSRVVGVSDGSAFQDFSLVDQNILEETITIVINSEIYARVDTLVFSDPADRHFEVVYSTDNVASVRFGNDTYGAIPGNNFEINASFAIGGGSLSNITAVNRVSVYAGGDSNVVAVSNPGSLTGGDDPEDIETAKRIGPLLLPIRDTFLTESDGQTLVEDFGGTSQVRVNGNAFGLLSAQVVIIPTGGGTSSATYRTNLQAYLVARTILESIDVRVEDATYITQNVTAQVQVLDGFVFADILSYIQIAFRLFFNETGLEIQRRYEADGISDAVTLLNTIFSTSFAVDDFDQLEPIISNLPARLIGENVQQSDVLGYIDTYVSGVDFVTISAPTFPISIGLDEITTDGTITVTEIT